MITRNETFSIVTLSNNSLSIERKVHGKRYWLILSLSNWFKDPGNHNQISLNYQLSKTNKLFDAD